MSERLLEPAVETRGRVTENERTYALEKLAQLARFTPGPVLDARLRLHLEPDPARERPAIVEASVDVDGRLVRAQVAAPTMREAVDLLEDRLRRRLVRLGERDQSLQLRHRDAGPGEWHHGDEPARRPEYFARPPEEREVVRRKAFALEAESADEATLDLELLDHDFLLFRNATTDEENLVHRIPEGGYALVQPTEHVEVLEGCAAPVIASPLVPARMSIDDARRLLDLGSEPFVFFLDARTGRGNVVYRRYDGHYGLITPAE
ncbi:MAG TPA: sigma 54 modulation/S30EA ribosomal C-terminal domain-containing protein [Acidimicrobiia bacterium]